MSEKVKCKYCGEEFSSTGIKRHENTCAKKHSFEDSVENNKVEEVKEEVKEGMTEKLTKAKELSNLAKKKASGRIRVPKDTEIIVMKNVLGGFTYEDKHTNKLFRIASGAVTTIMTMAELMAMHSRYPKILNDYIVVPIDTFDEDYPIEAVIENLNLTKAYSGAVNPMDIEGCLLDMPVDKFNQVVDSLSKGLKARIIEKSIELFRAGEFTDPTKKSIIIKMADNNDMIFDVE